MPTSSTARMYPDSSKVVRLQLRLP
jgi:hypothetical protein